MDDLNLKIAEMRLEEIRVYMSKAFGTEETRESALAVVIESFYSRHFDSIMKSKEAS